MLKHGAPLANGHAQSSGVVDAAGAAPGSGAAISVPVSVPVPMTAGVGRLKGSHLPRHKEGGGGEREAREGKEGRGCWVAVVAEEGTRRRG